MEDVCLEKSEVFQLSCRSRIMMCKLLGGSDHLSSKRPRLICTIKFVEKYNSSYFKWLNGHVMNEPRVVY